MKSWSIVKLWTCMWQIYEDQALKCKSTMLAIIKLQFNTFEPIRDLTLQLDMNHARINLNTIMRGWISLPRSSITRVEVQLGKSPTNSPSLQARLSLELNSLTLTLLVGCVQEMKEEMFCLQVYKPPSMLPKWSTRDGKVVIKSTIAIQLILI